MQRELWATYSVNDHLNPRALAADVMLFDRLVFPVPQHPDGFETGARPGPEAPLRWRADPAEWARWQDKGWQPEAQQRLLDLLKPVVRKVAWQGHGDIEDRYRVEAARLVAQGAGDWAFAATRSVVAQGLPAHVEGVAAVGPSFRSIEAFDRVASPQVGAASALPGKVLTDVLATEFLLPDPDDPRDAFTLLGETVDFVTGDADFRASRDAFNQWQHRFIQDGKTDAESIAAAIAEMRDLVADTQRNARRLTIRKVTRNIFRLAPSGLGIAAGIIGANPMFAIGGAFLSVGAITVDEKLFKSAEKGAPAATAFVQSARRHFGWPAS